MYRAGGLGGCGVGTALPAGARRLLWRACWLLIGGQPLRRGSPTVSVSGGYSGVGRLIRRALTDEAAATGLGKAATWSSLAYGWGSLQFSAPRHRYQPHPHK